MHVRVSLADHASSGCGVCHGHGDTVMSYGDSNVELKNSGVRGLQLCKRLQMCIDG